MTLSSALSVSILWDITFIKNWDSATVKNQSHLISSVGESPSGLNPSVLVSIAVLPSVEFTAMTILDYNSFVEFVLYY